MLRMTIAKILRLGNTAGTVDRAQALSVLVAKDLEIKDLEIRDLADKEFRIPAEGSGQNNRFPAWHLHLLLAELPTLKLSKAIEVGVKVSPVAEANQAMVANPETTASLDTMVNPTIYVDKAGATAVITTLKAAFQDMTIMTIVIAILAAIAIEVVTTIIAMTAVLTGILASASVSILLRVAAITKFQGSITGTAGLVGNSYPITSSQIGFLIGNLTTCPRRLTDVPGILSGPTQFWSIWTVVAFLT